MAQNHPQRPKPVLSARLEVIHQSSDIFKEREWLAGKRKPERRRDVWGARRWRRPRKGDAFGSPLASQRLDSLRLDRFSLASRLTSMEMGTSGYPRRVGFVTATRRKPKRAHSGWVGSRRRKQWKILGGCESACVRFRECGRDRVGGHEAMEEEDEGWGSDQQEYPTASSTPCLFLQCARPRATAPAQTGRPPWMFVRLFCYPLDNSRPVLDAPKTALSDEGALPQFAWYP